MNLTLDVTPTAADRVEANRLQAEDVLGNGNKIRDLMVSCYVAEQGEGGQPEEVHERRTDGTCRCGYNGPYRRR